MNRNLIITAAFVITLALAYIAATKAYAAIQRETPVDASVSVKLVICGDLNDDQTVNIFDALLSLKFVSNQITPTPLQKSLIDLTRDGAVDIGDSLAIIEKVTNPTNHISGCGPPG